MKPALLLLGIILTATASCALDTPETAIAAALPPPILVEFIPTPAPLPTPTPPGPPTLVTLEYVNQRWLTTPDTTPTPTPAPLPPEQAIETNPSCDIVNPPGWVTQPSQIVLKDGLTLPEARMRIWSYFQERFCEGGLFVKIAECEGLNPATGWDPAFINFADSVGVFQVNWVQGQPGGVVAGRWPEAVQTFDGNLWAAGELRRVNGGVGDWRPYSGHCFDSRFWAPFPG